MNDFEFTDSSRLQSVDYEVDGLVQGVFFRKYALQAARDIGVKGWVKKTQTGTVVGVLQGTKPQVAYMKEWLYKTGSPRCVTQGCVFRNEREIINCDYQHFTIEPSDW